MRPYNLVDFVGSRVFILICIYFGLITKSIVKEPNNNFFPKIQTLFGKVFILLSVRFLFFCRSFSKAIKMQILS